jgi:hypothetical protein
MERSSVPAGSGSSLAGQKIPTLHHPEGINPDQMFFDEAKVHNLILAYQGDGKPETWQKIVIAVLPLIDSLIKKYHFQVYENAEVLQHECVIKLLKAFNLINLSAADRFRF